MEHVNSVISTLQIARNAQTIQLAQIVLSHIFWTTKTDAKCARSSLLDAICAITTKLVKIVTKIMF
jgi:hypothetical protein